MRLIDHAVLKSGSEENSNCSSRHVFRSYELFELNRGHRNSRFLFSLLGTENNVSLYQHVLISSVNDHIFEIHCVTAVTVSNTVLLDVTPCSLVAI